MERCTSSLIWVGSTGYDSEFKDNCFQAWRRFLSSDFALYKNTEFEFLHPGVTPSHPDVPKMATPRRYIMKSCTVALANLADIPIGILPTEPPGPFPRSDLGRFVDFRSPIIAVRTGCLGMRKEVGWAAVGRQQAMAILVFSTSAPIDRMIPRGVIP
ncbi:hypothetical protein HO133_005315 [Letharia lupina]|uniref:Uncharacterized protein n=1 Tax=Letharia lupina TaxID=560253 RepID=A0A8H6C8D1_9LECA|nr:uncharacterized protein HO133_005315 [Letharia lupina]KAF6218772.1 hypothetical protein HO133_005315 [Letharia lupina]